MWNLSFSLSTPSSQLNLPLHAQVWFFPSGSLPTGKDGIREETNVTLQPVSLQEFAGSRETEISRNAKHEGCRVGTQLHCVGCSYLTPSCCRLSPPALPPLGLPAPAFSASFSHPNLLTHPNQSTLQAAPLCHCCPVPPLWRADTWWISFPLQIPAGCLTQWSCLPPWLLSSPLQYPAQSFAWSLPPGPQIKVLLMDKKTATVEKLDSF